MLDYYFCEECEAFHPPNRLINGEILSACECEISTQEAGSRAIPHAKRDLAVQDTQTSQTLRRGNQAINSTVVRFNYHSPRKIGESSGSGVIGGHVDTRQRVMEREAEPRGRVEQMREALGISGLGSQSKIPTPKPIRLVTRVVSPQKPDLPQAHKILITQAPPLQLPVLVSPMPSLQIFQPPTQPPQLPFNQLSGLSIEQGLPPQLTTFSPGLFLQRVSNQYEPEPRGKVHLQRVTAQPNYDINGTRQKLRVIELQRVISKVDHDQETVDSGINSPRCR